MISIFRSFVVMFFILSLYHLADAQGVDLSDLVGEITAHLEQQLVPVSGVVYEVRKDSVYLTFSDPLNIKPRTKLYAYTAFDTAIPTSPIAELEVIRISRQYPSARISRTSRPIPIKKVTVLLPHRKRLRLSG